MGRRDPRPPRVVVPSGAFATETTAAADYPGHYDVARFSRRRYDLNDSKGYRKEVGTWSDSRKLGTAGPSLCSTSHSNDYSNWTNQGPPKFGRGEGRHYGKGVVDTGAEFYASTTGAEAWKDHTSTLSRSNSPFKRNTRHLTSRTQGFVKEEFTCKDWLNPLPMGRRKYRPPSGKHLTTTGSTMVEQSLPEMQRYTRKSGLKDHVLEARIKSARSAPSSWVTSTSLSHPHPTSFKAVAARDQRHHSARAGGWR
mmetsp:Transcript_5110/g.17777  ORF Transcript_5110/g.17777 Transcript_5110/m.17777 type:complete len:253 (+) Transcript_5110:652-1410(+)